MKTFYSVTYSAIGADQLRTDWFESKEEADSFSDRDYYDAPVAHCCKKPETIAKYSELVKSDRNFR